jgi:tetratricopeptide (TPR) repeat protein
MRPNPMCTWLVLVAMAPAASGGDDPWKQPAMSKKDLVGTFAPRELETSLKQLDPDQAMNLKGDLAAAERLVTDPAARVAWATLTSSFLEGLSFTRVARAYAAWAVVQGPDSNVAAANLAAITCSPQLLRLAVDLDPKNPVPFTNLGSCALSAQQWEVARTAYEKAVALDPHHKLALLGLGQYWLHVPDIKQSIDYFVRANGYVMMKNAKSKVVPPEKPIEPTRNRQGGGAVEPASAGTGGGDEGGASRVTSTKMVLPPLPRWPTPDAFILSAKARRPLAAFYAERMGKGLKVAADMTRTNPFASKDTGGGLDEALNPKWDDTEPNRVLALNYAWAGEKLQKANEELVAADKDYKKLGKALAEVARVRNQRVEALCPPGSRGLEAASKCILGARDELANSCKESMSLNGKLFAAYRDSYARWYDQMKPVLEETWRVQGLWIRQIADPTLFDIAVAARDAFVFGPLSTRMIEEDMMRLTFAGEGAAAFGLSAEVCPKVPPPKTDPEAAPTLPDAKNPDHECPLPNDGLDIPPFSIPGLGLPISFNVKCKEASFKFTAGFGKWKTKDEAVSGGAGAVLKVTYRFGTDKSTVVYVGIEGSLKAKTVADSAVGVKAGGGVGVEFNKNGQITNVDTNIGVGSSVDLPAGAGKGSIGLSGSIEKGAPSIDFKASGSGANPFF